MPKLRTKYEYTQCHTHSHVWIGKLVHLLHVSGELTADMEHPTVAYTVTIHAISWLRCHFMNIYVYIPFPCVFSCRWIYFSVLLWSLSLSVNFHFMFVIISSLCWAWYILKLRSFFVRVCVCVDKVQLTDIDRLLETPQSLAVLRVGKHTRDRGKKIVIIIWQIK